MSGPSPIDLRHRGVPWTIASYLLPGNEPAIVDCGPTTCLPALEAGLADHGLGPADLRHVILTHVHLDHAGAAGALVRRNPGLLVHVGEVGAPHLLDPSRLERSARRLWGDAYDTLWGELAPVPEENLRVIGRSVHGLEAFPTPGHASHHVSFLAPDGSCYSGDAAGVRIGPAGHVRPVAPPPDIDLEAWARTLDEIGARRPERLCVSHFGVHDDVGAHLALMRERLAVWAERVRGGMTEDAFVALADEELEHDVSEPAILDAYQTSGAAGSSFAGLERYWRKRDEAQA
jgi:glyoxylase-like metal-dependent hydrolase (beta-lactamase superfamily II)